MLVNISKGIINITPKIFNAVLMEDQTGPVYSITLVPNTYEDDSNKGIVLTYSPMDVDTFKEDFQKLKDCFFDICRRQDINVYNEHATPSRNETRGRVTAPRDTPHISAFWEGFNANTIRPSLTDVIVDSQEDIVPARDSDEE